MPDALSGLQDQKNALLRKISQLGDFRPGSVTTTTGRCGNPHCHCHQPNDPGHGPNFRLTYKANGKTVTQSFPTPAARRKAEREIEEYRKWQPWSHELVEVNTALCRLRPIEEQAQTPQEKNRGNDPAGDQPRSRASAAAHLRRTSPDWSLGFRSSRDGDAFCPAPSRSGGAHSPAAVCSSAAGTAPTALCLRPDRSLGRVASQIRAHGGRDGRMSTPLLPV